ncbi:MAG: flagellar biosynthesis protein FlhA [Deltaproteobacteria bacterium]|nr:flagellar biosynthesis protein FlhA [Deltaproteobacteria bacterium]
MQFKNVFLIAFISVLGVLLVAPVPPTILDIMIVFNFSCSIFILLSCLFSIQLRNFLIYPTLLLLLTLLRIATNVATTRMILTNAYAGDIINAFGRLLIKGDLVVGLIIFSLISLISLIVISRGALRISEVAARFTLEAMPARQASIEQEYRSGLVSFSDAQKLRDDLKKESMLYGSMEGAMKFIQGDAIISIVAVVVNLAGGIYVGLRQKLTFDQSLQKYAVLSVGDGLVAQIPALFLAISAGIIVSRVSSVAYENVFNLVKINFGNKFETLLATSIILFALGLVPGIPFWPFFIFSCVFLILGVKSYRSNQYDVQVSDTAKFSQGQCRLFISKEHVSDIGSIVRFSNDLRSTLSKAFGVPIPEIEITSIDERTSSLVASNKSFKLDTFSSSKILINVPDFYREFLKEKDANSFKIPFSGLNGLLIAKTLKNLSFVNSLRLQSFRSDEYLVLRAYEILLDHPDLFFDVSTALSIVRQLVREVPELESIVHSERFIAITKFSELLKMLIKKRLGVVSLALLVEKIYNLCLKFNHSRNDDTLTVDDFFELLVSENLFSLLVPVICAYSDKVYPTILKPRSDEWKLNWKIFRFNQARNSSVGTVFFKDDPNGFVKTDGFFDVSIHQEQLKRLPLCNILEL